MRLTLLSILVGASTLTSQVAARLAPAMEEKAEATYFNSKKVPPLLDLTPDTFASELKKSKYLFVKHYSPFCPHCNHYAPAYQTTYEYYYTSSPALPSAEEEDFTDFYDFRFAKINCIAYSDLCVDNGVNTFPTTILYKEGESYVTIKSAVGIKDLSKTIEDVLTAEHPGSRPSQLFLPSPGEKQTPEEEGGITEASSEKTSSKKVSSEKASAEKASKSSEESSGKSDEQAGKVSLDDVTERPSAKTGKTGGKTGDKSTFGGDWEAPTSAERFEKKKKKKPAKTGVQPNPDGASVPLDPHSFERSVALSSEPWFIKFYAPWCHHCQALAPTWQQIGKAFKGKLNIGEVNCEKERKLCKDLDVRGYPDLRFYKGAEKVEYTGLRGLGDLVQYADQALELADGVPDVTLEEFEKLEKQDDVIFVYFYDHATATEDFEALERLPLNLIGRAKLVKTGDPKLSERFKITTWPRLLVSREGRPTYFTPLTPSEMRDDELVLGWAQSVWLPLVPELTASNADQVMNGKIVVLAVLERDHVDSYNKALSEMKNAASDWMDRQIKEFQTERAKLREAKQMKIKEAKEQGNVRAARKATAIHINMDMSKKKEVVFAWADGVFWKQWLHATYGVDVKQGERVIVNDQDSHVFWDTTVSGDAIEVTTASILETLDKVVYHPQELNSKLTVSIWAKQYYDSKRRISQHPFLAAAAFVTGGALLCYFRIRKRSRRARGHFRMDDLGAVRDFKDSVRGHNGYAKAD